jgi:serine protease Do
MARSFVTAATLAACTLLFCLSAEPARAQDSFGTPITSVGEARKAVVHIESIGAFVPLGEDGTSVQQSTGTGFIIDEEGIVVTNAHVVNGGEAFYVYLDGEDAPQYATVLGISECSDLAVLDMRGRGYPYLAWAGTPPQLGERVYALGYPSGRYRMTRGTVSDAYLAADTAWASVGDVIYHTATIAPGNSGGPLLNAKAQVLGVNFANQPYDAASVAVASAEAQQVVELLALGIDQDSIGINGEAFLIEDEDVFGIWVVSVDSDSPAAAMGIQPADILLSLEKIPLGMGGNLGSYCTVLRSHAPGEIMHMVVARVATEEVLCGQLNGEPLFNCSSFMAAEPGQGSDVGTASGSGIYRPTAESSVRSTITVQGIAVHPDFWKWQVDLLVDGAKETFIGGGETPVPAVGDLVSLNTGLYPNGRHVLRLRVVRKDGNYDEYYTAINIQN